MITIRPLIEIPFEAIIDCLLEAFTGYFVRLPEEVHYWKDRFKGARVDFECSFGAFVGDNLVGFIINGVDRLNGKLTAFNTGTGVIEKYRGNRIVDQLYAYAMPVFIRKGVEVCQLEVIQENERAIYVYERIGFKVIRSLKSFKGELRRSPNNLQLQKFDFHRELMDDAYYSWDYKNSAIQCLNDKYTSYYILNDAGKRIGHFTINEMKKDLARFETVEDTYDNVLSAVSLISKEVSCNNVDDRLVKKLEALTAFGLVNRINQFEMEMNI